MLIENSKLLDLTKNLRDGLRSRPLETIDDLNFRTVEFVDSIHELSGITKGKFQFIDNRIWYGTNLSPKMNLLHCQIKPRMFHEEFNIFTKISDIMDVILKYNMVETVSPFKYALEIKKIGSELIEIKNLFDVDRVMLEYENCIKNDRLFNMGII